MVERFANHSMDMQTVEGDSEDIIAGLRDMSLMSQSGDGSALGLVEEDEVQVTANVLCDSTIVEETDLKAGVQSTVASCIGRLSVKDRGKLDHCITESLILKTAVQVERAEEAEVESDDSTDDWIYDDDGSSITKSAIIATPTRVTFASKLKNTPSTPILQPRLARQHGEHSFQITHPDLLSTAHESKEIGSLPSAGYVELRCQIQTFMVGLMR